MRAVILGAGRAGQLKYIVDALEGFLIQKTNFAFEILVHEDASADPTAEIIRNYEKRYPDLIKPIYETENQYSKQDGSLACIQFGRVKGKYVAICEGDDYWTDPFKLKKQFDTMERNPQVDMCVHKAKLIDARTNRLRRSFLPISIQEKEERCIEKVGDDTYANDREI